MTGPPAPRTASSATVNFRFRILFDIDGRQLEHGVEVPLDRARSVVTFPATARESFRFPFPASRKSGGQHAPDELHPSVQERSHPAR